MKLKELNGLYLKNKDVASKSFFTLIAPVVPQNPTVTDIDGNVYHTVIIGTQQWMVENLITEHYADGTLIPNLTLDADWNAEDGTPGHDGAYCWYDNDIAYKNPYGAIYNGFAVNNLHGLAPTGWRIPTKADFESLETVAGGSGLAGGKLKEVGILHWLTINIATNDYGFKAVGGGNRGTTGPFSDIKVTNVLWASTLLNPDNNWRMLLYYSHDNSAISTNWIKYGFSVRCVRDV